MMDAFLIRALLAGLAVALAAGPLGVFVVWRRMAYFGDATAHAAILGIALALGLSLPLVAGVLVAALAIGAAAAALSDRGHAADTALGVLSHGALAAGLVAVALSGGARVDLTAFLFGDILAVGWADVAVMWAGAAGVVALIGWRWSRLLTATVSDELAVSDGIDPRREKLILTLAMALTVAVSIKVVGALLIGAMLIIPAATARAWARSPEVMALWAVIVAACAVGAGLWASWTFDIPAGPGVVCAAAAAFALSLGLRRP
ncbi:metal ABC transporter permease [Anianabacter salinae]|uniref:metal ABC transporter permease n=1 Tax=Anianabacter salinae TaxID=2851023 RepID=UPI00225DCE3B|nr:metal ABC transporter permease [Anianabacter salinae]MBV0910883.1 metal ABC transporter permease [Anianabacter salinae]